MPTPRKSQRLHLIEGTFRKDRHGELPDINAILEPLGDAPKLWPAVKKEIWKELAGLLPPGVAERADRTMFEVLVNLTWQMRRSPSTMTPALAGQLRATCGVFGMSPAGRATLAVPTRPISGSAESYVQHGKHAR